MSRNSQICHKSPVNQDTFWYWHSNLSRHSNLTLWSVQIFECRSIFYDSILDTPQEGVLDNFFNLFLLLHLVPLCSGAALEQLHPFYIVNLGKLLHFWGAAPLWFLWPSILQGENELSGAIGGSPFLICLFTSGTLLSTFIVGLILWYSCVALLLKISWIILSLHH